MSTLPELTFRDATIADVPAVVALVESAYRGDVSRQGWTTEADLLGGRRTGPDDVLSCLERPRPARCGCVDVADDDGVGYFGMFSVRPGLQGGGIGKALLAEAERIVREEWQLPMMQMTVIDVRDELIAFYERRGYRRTGILKPFPYGDERFGQPRRDDLRFEILEKRW